MSDKRELNLGGEIKSIWRVRSDYWEKNRETKGERSNKIAINTVEDEKDPELKESREMRKWEEKIMIRRDEPLAGSKPIWNFEMHTKGKRAR